IELGKILSAQIPFVEVTQADAKKCCLNGIEARIVPANRIDILLRGTVVPKYLNLPCNGLIIRNDSARISKGSQVLCWIETEACRIRQVSCRGSGVPSPMCVRC